MPLIKMLWCLFEVIKETTEPVNDGLNFTVSARGYNFTERL